MVGNPTREANDAFLTSKRGEKNNYFCVNWITHIGSIDICKINRSIVYHYIMLIIVEMNQYFYVQEGENYLLHKLFSDKES